MIVLTLAVLLQAQTAREMALAQAERVHPQEFTQIRGVRELPDGRVLVSDRLDKGVVVVDFATSAVRSIGRPGRGPAEYRLPTSLTPLPGDSTLLSDEGNSRIAVIGPDLRIHRSFTVMLPGISMPLAARSFDRRGRVYLQIPAWISSARSPNDTIPIVRFDRATQKVDTIARIKGASWLPPGPRYGFGWVVFAPQDVWTVAPDGRIAVVRSGDYHVEWYAPNGVGSMTRGASVAFTRIPVTMDERLAYVRTFLDNSSISGRDAEGAMSPVPADMKDEESVREMATKNTFAETKAAFTDAAPVLGPDATLWVERSTRVGETPLWDVFDGSGKLTLRVRLPSGRQLGGVGAKSLYLIATDDDGVQRLERYARPGR